jgi:hypothetical protein
MKIYYGYIPVVTVSMEEETEEKKKSRVEPIQAKAKLRILRRLFPQENIFCTFFLQLTFGRNRVRRM